MINPDLLVCACGHIADEHTDYTGGCEVDGCLCVAFEHDPEAQGVTP